MECEYLSNDIKVIDMDADHELEMNLSRREIRLLLLHEFRLGHKATEAANHICSTMGEDVLFIRTAQYWFNRFKNGNFELDDLPRPSRPLEVDLMTSHRNYQWLRNLITGDEKWVLYINCTHRRQWLSPGQTGVTTPKADLHPKKVMLSVWWECQWNYSLENSSKWLHHHC